MSDKRSQTVIFGGDTSIGYDGEKFFEGIARIFENADFRIMQLETAYVDRVSEFAKDYQTTAMLEPLLGRTDLVTLSGNHLYDLGETGVRDMINWLDTHGIARAGGDVNIALASRPAFIEKDGTRIGVLAYNAQGPKISFASDNKGGCAYVDFVRAMTPVGEDCSRHENDVYDYRQPVDFSGSVMIDNYLSHESLMRMSDDVQKARSMCDILLVYFHKGWVHRPVTVAPWERLLCRTAIDAGADAVFGSHSHILHGCECYRGKVIFHGLNNFVMWLPDRTKNISRAKQTEFSNHDEFAKKREARFGFRPDPEYPTYPFHPDSIYSIAAKLIIKDGKIADTRYIPLLLGKDCVMRPVTRENGGQRVFDYMKQITDGALLNAEYSWCGDEVIVKPR